MRLRPCPQCPGKKAETTAGSEIAKRRQDDGNAIRERRGKIDQTLHGTLLD
jgi:hypothetical protein